MRRKDATIGHPVMEVEIWAYLTRLFLYIKLDASRDGGIATLIQCMMS